MIFYVQFHLLHRHNHHSHHNNHFSLFYYFKQIQCYFYLLHNQSNEHTYYLNLMALVFHNFQLQTFLSPAHVYIFLKDLVHIAVHKSLNHISNLLLNVVMINILRLPNPYLLVSNSQQFFRNFLINKYLYLGKDCQVSLYRSLLFKQVYQIYQ